MTALLDTSKVVVGQSGSGKTVTAKAEVSELIAQRRHVAVIDPTGVWWGMRLDAAGQPNGAQLYVFGGEHGDVAIRPDQGAAIARIIVGQRVSAIVDLSSIDNSRDWRMFVADFVAELRKKPKALFHLVVDEADEFAAERPADDIGFALRENMVWIAKRGRVRGFVPTFITQRTAEIAKAVISQAQTVIAHQLIAPSDQKAIDDYLKGHGSADIRKQVMSSLAELEVGERWIYSPRLKLLVCGTTPALTTFDSSRTPEAGETPIEPRSLAELDVSAITAALAPAEPHPADVIPSDPAAAYAKGSAVGDLLADRDRRIAELEESLANLEESDAMELIVRDERIADLEATIADQAAELAHLRGVDAECDGYNAGLTAIEELVLAVRSGTWRADRQGDDANMHRGDADMHAAAPAAAEEQGGVAAGSQGAGSPPPPTSRPEQADADAAPNAPAGTDLAPRLQELLDWLAWGELVFGEGPLARERLSLLVQRHVRTKGFLNDLGTLRSAGMIEYADGGGVALTGLGATKARPAAAPTTLAQLRVRVAETLTPAQRHILEHITGAYPAAIARERLAELVGQHVRTKSFLNNVGRLRSLGLVTYPPAGGVRAADFLMRKGG